MYKLLLQDKYSDYESALIQLNLETLSVKREKLLEKFATTRIANRKLHEFFNIRNPTHHMKLRNQISTEPQEQEQNATEPPEFF